ncbi:MAG: MATE family efflux transporter, partial [Gammaproteobacteria bacterium]|nr:MATE family efflux transporter [Gammaproteobacteria bacterium]
DEVLQFTREYFDIRIWSAPATLANYALLGWFLGRGLPRINLYLVVAGNLLNILLDLLFVIYWHWQVAGVAWATVISEYLVLLAGLSLVLKQNLSLLKQLSWYKLFSLQSFMSYLKFNRDIFFRTLFLLTCFSFFTISSAGFGEQVLAANAVLMNLQSFMAYVLDSIAHAVEVLIGKNYFRNKQSQLVAIIRQSLKWCFVAGVLFSLLYMMLGEWIISLLTDIEKVQQTASQYLIWLILSPVLSVWSYWFDGAYIGANQAKYMRNTMLFSMLGFFALYFLLQFAGNHGLWAALMGLMLFRALSMAYVAWRKQLWSPSV